MTDQPIPPSYDDWYRDTYDTAMGGFPPQLIYEEQWGAKRRQYLEEQWVCTSNNFHIAAQEAQKAIVMGLELVKQRNHLIVAMNAIALSDSTAEQIRTAAKDALVQVNEMIDALKKKP